MSTAWIDRASALAADALGGAAVIGLDTEFMRRNTFYPKLALIQLAAGERHWLIDPLAFDAGPLLRDLLDHRRCCVMHSAGEDLEVLAPLLGGATMRLFDTQIAAAMCGMGASLSYQKLVATLLGIELPKGETRSDWLHRPLSAGQFDYAEQDVAYLETLHARLSERLQRRARTAWHAEDCARLVQRAQRNGSDADPQPQRAFRTAAEWPRAAQARLRRVLRWRDAAARRLDKPRPWLLDDASALALAQHPPETPNALYERTRAQRALRGPQRAELFSLLRAPIDTDELAELAPIPHAPRGESKAAVGAMKTAVDAMAHELDLPAGLLCPRRLIEEYAVTRQWPDGLEGWRRSLLEPKLAALLPC